MQEKYLQRTARLQYIYMRWVRPQGQWTPWIILPVESSLPKTTATQTALLCHGHKQCRAFIFPSPGSSCSFSIRERVRQKYCWGRMLQQNKLATTHKSSNYCLRLLLQKQFITQVFLWSPCECSSHDSLHSVEGERKKRKKKKNQTPYIISEPTSLSKHLSLCQPESPLPLELLLIRFSSLTN